MPGVRKITVAIGKWGDGGRHTARRSDTASENRARKKGGIGGTVTGGGGGGGGGMVVVVVYESRHLWFTPPRRLDKYLGLLASLESTIYDDKEEKEEDVVVEGMKG